MEIGDPDYKFHVKALEYAAVLIAIRDLSREIRTHPCTEMEPGEPDVGAQGIVECWRDWHENRGLCNACMDNRDRVMKRTGFRKYRIQLRESLIRLYPAASVH